MKRILLLLLSFCLIVALLVICVSLGNNYILGGPVEKNKNIIYVGVYEPLTGDYAPNGLSEVLGIRYANSVSPTVDINGLTYDVKLVEADSGANVTDPASAADTLVNAKVSAALGAYGSQATAEGLAVFDNAGIPLVGISCTSELATANSLNYFRMCYTDSFQSGVMANFAYSMNFRHAAVLTQTGDAYSKEAGRVFSDEFIRLGGQVEAFSFQLGQENFASLNKELIAGDIDFVFMLSGSSEAKYFIKQSRDEGLNCPIMGPESWDSAILISDASYYSRAVYFSSEFDSSESANPVSAEFASSFSSWLGRDAERGTLNGGDYTSSASAMAYDAYMLVIKAIKAVNSADPQAVAAALRTVSYDGITGNITFDEKGNSLRDFAFIKTINTQTRQFELLQTSSLGK